MRSSDHDFAEEIANLHRFFEEWFRGTGDRKISEFSGRLDSEFVIVNPDGHRHDKSQIVEMVKGRAGSEDSRIWTTDAALAITDPVLIGTYREHREVERETTHLLATVSMVSDESIPTGYRWLSVHETWTDEQA